MPHRAAERRAAERRHLPLDLAAPADAGQGVGAARPLDGRPADAATRSVGRDAHDGRQHLFPLDAGTPRTRPRDRRRHRQHSRHDRRHRQRRRRAYAHARGSAGLPPEGGRLSASVRGGAGFLGHRHDRCVRLPGAPRGRRVGGRADRDAGRHSARPSGQPGAVVGRGPLGGRLHDRAAERRERPTDGGRASGQRAGVPQDHRAPGPALLHPAGTRAR